MNCEALYCGVFSSVLLLLSISFCRNILSYSITLLHYLLILVNNLLCDKLISRPDESYQLWCVVVRDLRGLEL